MREENSNHLRSSWVRRHCDLTGTSRDADRGKFRTPSLRNVALTGPWWHDGSARTLDEAVAKHGLTHDAAEVTQLIAFLTALSDKLTLIRIFEELRGRGYDGGYDAVRRYARRWSKERGQSTAAAYVPLSFAPGEAYQFDRSHEIVLLNGVTVLVKVAHVRLCHSRMLFARAYPRETQELVFDAHDREPGSPILRSGSECSTWIC